MFDNHPARAIGDQNKERTIERGVQCYGCDSTIYYGWGRIPEREEDRLCLSCQSLERNYDPWFEA